MKASRIAVCLLSLLLCISVLTACKDDAGDGEQTADVYYTVTFNSNGGTEIEPKLVKNGGTLSEMPLPTRDGYIFDGWHGDGKQWSTYTTVSADVTLTARWISAESTFECTPSGDGETTVITRLKKQTEEIRLPTLMGGYRVTAIGDGVFANLSNDTVKRIIIPDTITSVGDEAFYSSEGIEIVIEGALSSVGEKAFWGCDGLSEVKLGGGIETVSAEAFTSSGLVSVSIPETVKVIDENAFSDCAALRTIFMHDSIELIGDSAFWDTGLDAIYFYGSDETVSALLDTRVGPQNDVLADEETKRYIYSETEPTVNTEYDGFWYFNDNGQTRIW